MSTPPATASAGDSEKAGWVTIAMPTMIYRPCPACSAPIVNPFPPSWTFDMIKEGPSGGPVTAYGTPHRDSCQATIVIPEPGIAVRTPGTYVGRLDIYIDACPVVPVRGTRR